MSDTNTNGESTRTEDAESVLRAVERSALVFYEHDRWRPFDDTSPESRVTKPDERTHVQFNHMPGRPPHAEYRGPLGRWWVRIDGETGMPSGEPVEVTSTDSSSSMVN